MLFKVKYSFKLSIIYPTLAGSLIPISTTKALPINNCVKYFNLVYGLPSSKSIFSNIYLVLW